jgi:hypothetical protein
MKAILLAVGCACLAIALAVLLAGRGPSEHLSMAREQVVEVSKNDAATAATDKAPENALQVHAALLDGFEGTDYTVWAFDSADDEGTADYVTDGATQGKSALRITLRGKGAKGKLHLRREVNMDLSQASAVLVDVTSPADNLSVALALKSAPNDIYQEIKPVSLKAGLNRGIRFPLDRNVWKNEKTKWEYNGPPVNLQSVRRLILLLNTGEESKGAFVIDSLRVEGAAIQSPEDAGAVYREWRPEIVALKSPPNAVTQFSTVNWRVAFRASYRDLFDPGDICVGVRVTTPSGKNLDATGFFAGLCQLPEGAVQEALAAAPRPAWGPFTSPDKKKEKKDAGQPGTTKAGKEPVKAEAGGDPTPQSSAGQAARGPDDAAAEDKSSARLPENVLPMWTVRFTPQETGRYTLQLYIRNGVGETRVPEHSLVVSPEMPDAGLPGRTGGNVRVSRRDPRQLELQDGSPFFIVGQNVCWTTDWAPYLDKMKTYGANTCRIWLCPWGLNLERKTAPGTYDLQEAERIDALMAKAEATGVRIIFCFTFHGMNADEWHQSPYNQANGGPCARPQEFFTDGQAKRQFRRLLTYAAARWGASPALLSWELMNELDLARYDHPDDAGRWAGEMAGYLKRVDAHGHLVTVSVSNTNFQPELWEDGRIDFVSVHAYGTDVGPLVARTLSPYLPVNKPVLLGEFGGGWEAADDIPDKDGARLQAALWLTACSPSCGMALPWWWDTYIEARGLYPVMEAAGRFTAGEDRRGRYREQVRKNFANGVEAWGVMDACGGRFYVHNPTWIRLPESRGPKLLAAPAPLEMSGLMDGAYRVEFWDARMGKVFSSVEAAANDGVLRVELPAHATEFGVKVERKERVRLELR